MTLAKNVISFLKKEDGPTAVEYAVMLALIIVVCIAAIIAIGTNANATFSTVGSAIKPSASWSAQAVTQSSTRLTGSSGAAGSASILSSARTASISPRGPPT